MDRSRTLATVGMLALALLVSSCSAWRDVWHDWGVTAIDGATLTVWVPVGSGSCNRFDRLDVEETDQDVRITAIVEQKTGLVGGCTDDMTAETVEVTLERPLGDRQLLGCAPGPEGLQNYFGDVRQDGDCAEVIAHS